MIRSKDPQLVDAQNGAMAVVYMEIHDMEMREKRLGGPIVSYLVSKYMKNENGILVPIDQSIAMFKMSTWLNLFGALTMQYIQANKDQLFITQIGYVNALQYDGTELQRVRYWPNTTAADWEIVP